ncbi:uncharacterized protein LOC108113901 [Drosophila eugracilis]|uniref:uncharacterized protein LOC108113901 n=1 Tax=Drosophila eugracilis TaxID=29029 RepID=UPI0007E5FC33|nr:uncharacterized protein LOC108113901 [Drosophila eugracilis]
MLAFFFIWLLLIDGDPCQPMYIILPTQVPRSFDLREESYYQEPIEGIEFIDDPAKLFTVNDFFGEAQKFVMGVQKFVQHPSTSLYSAFNQLQSNAKKNHQKQKPVKHRVVLDPFGNISFTLSWSANLQVFNSFGFKTRSLVNYNAWPKG